MTNRSYYLLILIVFLALVISESAFSVEGVSASERGSQHHMYYAVKACTPNEKWFTQVPSVNSPVNSPVNSATNSGSLVSAQASPPQATDRIEIPENPGEKLGKISEAWIVTFSKYLQGKITPIESFSQALALRRLASNPHERVFSEYWLSRVLLASGMVHLSEIGFKSVLEEEITDHSTPFQIASLSCLNNIKRKQGTTAVFENPEFLVSTLVSLKEKAVQLGDSQLGPIWEAGFHSLVAILALGNPSSITRENQQKLLNLLQGAGPYELLAQGIYHSYLAQLPPPSSGSAPQNRQASAEHLQAVIQYLQSFLAAKSLPEALAVMRDQALLLTGRAWYSLGAYDKAILSYKRMNMRSNEWVHGLSELAWSYLMAGYYREAIGVGVGVQSGALKRTFSPETTMVMAMALNEMCYFPEALKMVNKFKKDYTSSYLWLKDKVHPSQEKTVQTPYQMAINYAKNSPESKTPVRIASEWIRSPIFLTEQDQINLAIRERSTSALLTEQGTREQTQLAQDLTKELREVRAKYLKAKIQLQEGQALPSDLTRRIVTIKQNLERFSRIRSAAPVWRQMLAHFENRAQEVSHRAISNINASISQLNMRMFGQLEDIAENHELMEVEIYNGASEDIIWQNAHPDYKKVINKMKIAKTENSADKVWDWGTTLGGLDGRGEIWEDEVGSLSASLRDNCESKDKYLAIKSQFQNEL